MNCDWLNKQTNKQMYPFWAHEEMIGVESFTSLKFTNIILSHIIFGVPFCIGRCPREKKALKGELAASPTETERSSCHLTDLPCYSDPVLREKNRACKNILNK